MGRRGPQPKDKRLDELDGNPGKRPPKPDAVKASGEAVAPDWLGEYARGIWEAIIISMPPNFYASVDTMILASYCQAAQMIFDASIDIKDNGITIKNGSGSTVKNPVCAVLSDGMAKIATLGSRLGLDPASRQSMGIYAKGLNGSESEKPETEFGDLISLPGGKK